MLRGSKLYSIFTGTCPVCHSSKMYEEKNAYNLSKITKMHEKCENCGTKYKIEPSFFYGAMYVSYGVGVAIAVATFIISHYFIGLEKLTAFWVILAAMILLMPINLRLSRNIWINFFFSYQKEKDAKA